ncbi:MAG: RNA polymerase sigma factor [Chlorobi bacterium]|nr:RNA polymerase sigma factor [Chlorobiota bacterium]
MNKTTEQEIIKGCQKGDPEAQETLYKMLAPKLYAVCITYLKNKEDAADVLQEAFIKIFTKIDMYKKNGSIEAWARKITINTIIDFIRKRKSTTEFIEAIDPGEVEISSQLPGIIEQLEAKELQEIIQQLPEGARVAFLMHAVEGYSHEEIAKELGISIGTSKSQVARARKLLQKMIKEKWNARQRKI